MSKLAQKEKLFTTGKAMRDAYTETMVNMGREDERIMVVDVDCSRSMGSGAFVTHSLISI